MTDLIKIFIIFDLIIAHTPISAQSGNSDYIQCVFCLLVYKGICFGYPFELHQLVDAIQMSTKNICIYTEKKNNTISHKHHLKFFADLFIYLFLVLKNLSTQCGNLDEYGTFIFQKKKIKIK